MNFFDEENELENIVVLNDAEYEWIDIIRYNDDQYVILRPIVQEDSCVTIIKMDMEGNFIAVPDENTLNTVYELFKEKYKDVYIFDDDE